MNGFITGSVSFQSSFTRFRWRHATMLFPYFTRMLTARISRAYTLRIASISPSCGTPIGHPSKSAFSCQSHSESPRWPAEALLPRPAIEVGHGTREWAESHRVVSRR